MSFRSTEKKGENAEDRRDRANGSVPKEHQGALGVAQKKSVYKKGGGGGPRES